MRWFRFYCESLDDPKVQRLSGDLFKTWVNCLCISSQNDGYLPGTMEDIAFSLRLDIKETEARIEVLKAVFLLDVTADGRLHPHNWNGRQYSSDDSSNRVRALRKRSQAVTVTGNVTPSDTEQIQNRTDTETEQTNCATPLASLEMDRHSAATGLGALVGMSSSGYNFTTLVSAIEQGKRRWPELRNEEVAEKIKALWDEYAAQPIHAKQSLKNWLDSVGRYIDSPDWKVKKLEEFKPQIDWQGGYVGPDGVYVNKSGKRIPGFICPPAPKGAEA